MEPRYGKLDRAESQVQSVSFLASLQIQFPKFVLQLFIDIRAASKPKHHRLFYITEIEQKTSALDVTVGLF